VNATICTLPLRRILLPVVLALLVLAPGIAHAATPIGWFDYAHHGTNVWGTLTWKYTWDDVPPVYSAASWRAGSGSYPDDRTNGRLPDGWYSIRGHWNNYSGSAIYGRVWYLSDKRSVTTGVMRTALFIHTEETPSNGQYNPTSGDDPQCWEGAIDYKSLGCVKLAWNADIAAAHDCWNYRGGSTAHGSTYPYPFRSKLYVH